MRPTYTICSEVEGAPAEARLADKAKGRGEKMVLNKLLPHVFSAKWAGAKGRMPDASCESG
jgi:hypothetical protein